MEFLNNHISVKHKEEADVVDAPQEITIESRKPEMNGMYTISFIKDSKYPTLRQEFSKNCGSNFEICSGRHEKSFLISFTNAADLWAALVGQKEGLIGMRSLKLVFEKKKPEDTEEKL